MVVRRGLAEGGEIIWGLGLLANSGWLIDIVAKLGGVAEKLDFYMAIVVRENVGHWGGYKVP